MTYIRDKLDESVIYAACDLPAQAMNTVQVCIRQLPSQLLLLQAHTKKTTADSKEHSKISIGIPDT